MVVRGRARAEHDRDGEILSRRIMSLLDGISLSDGHNGFPTCGEPQVTSTDTEQKQASDIWERMKA